MRSGELSFKHYNSRVDVGAATDASGSLTYQAAYEAFGKHGEGGPPAPGTEDWGINPDRQQANTYGDGSTASGGNSNQLVSFTEGASSVTFTYDANGNRATRTENGQSDTYSYDYENRLLGLDYQTGSTATGA